jgi:dihydrofolate synthase/folylpolyglutamate synthase
MFASDLKHASPALAEKLSRLYTLDREKTIDLGFRPPYLELLKRFKDPHLQLPPVVHVAGTNGKGSTIAFLRAALEAASLKVHVYTSPHLIEFNERIVLAGKQIEDDMLDSLIDEALALNNGGSVTFFEITTAMAFAAFSRTPADIVLLETGLGGRLDCTNVVPNPILTIITSIGFDHMEHLGDTLESIAIEKFGIIKRGIPCVIAPQSDVTNCSDVLKIFDRITKNHQSEPYRYGNEWSVDKQESRIHFIFKNSEHFFLAPSMLGPHQVHNAATALAALHVLKTHFDIPAHAMEQAMVTAQWPGRLQGITHGKLGQPLLPGWELWLDGGHNTDAAHRLAQQAQTWSDKPLHVILAMMNHKDPVAFVSILKPHIQSLRASQIPAEPQALTATALGKALNCPASPTITESIAAILQQNDKPGRILITGSLYLVGHVLKESGL